MSTVGENKLILKKYPPEAWVMLDKLEEHVSVVVVVVVRLQKMFCGR